MSEPEFLLRTMDRRDDWCALICLIGGGQEINTGEAGILEWIRALETKLPAWKVYVSPNINLPDYGTPELLAPFRKSEHVAQDKRLHLAACMRSLRAESLARSSITFIWTGRAGARIGGKFLLTYPIYLTRNLMRPEGIHVKADIDPGKWFWNAGADVHSSCYLEDVATEFDVQGLELNWVGVCWDGNLGRFADGWKYEDFKGTRWQRVHDSERARNIYDANRVC